MTSHGLAREIRVMPGGYTEDEGAKAAQLLLADGLPTAVIASNDLSAIGLLDSMLRADVRVPEDLSVVGSTTHGSPGCPASTSPRCGRAYR
jgi:DNA-binding LacI/PurR family transcriptional regulator